MSMTQPKRTKNSGPSSDPTVKEIEVLLARARTRPPVRERIVHRLVVVLSFIEMTARRR